MVTEALRKIFEKHGVKLAYLFGSQSEAGIRFIAGREVTPEAGSDLDIGLVFTRLPERPYEKYGELYVDLSTLFEPFDVDLVFLQETNFALQYEAIKGEVIYTDDESFRDDYEEMVMKRASDLAFKRKAFEKDFLKAVGDGYFEVRHR